jgi:hypothetical protein
VDIPDEVKVAEKSIHLREKMREIVKTAESGDLAGVVPEIVELERDLGKIVNDFISRLKRSEIDLTEAEAQLEYYLGIQRAIAILRSISGGSLKRFNERDEKKRIAEDRKRWYESLKNLDEE